MVIYFNGKYKNTTSKELRQIAPGAVQGKGVFETMNIVKGEIIDKEEHLKRLHRGLKRFGISRRVSSSFLDRKVQYLLKRNQLNNARLRLSVSKYHGKITFSIVVQRRGPQRKGYTLGISSICRPLNAFTHLKSIRYEVFQDALEEVRSKGYDEALLLNVHKKIVEVSTANIIWVKGKTIFTPAQRCGCLNGVTRNRILAQLRQQGYRIKKGAYTLKDLLAADAVFLTNSLIGLKPVTRIQGKRFKIFQLPIARS